MGLLRNQKELQKQYYEEQKLKRELEDPPRETPKGQSKQPRKGPIKSASDVQKFNDLVTEDMATYKGLPVEDKLPIKTRLIKKYKDHVEWVLSTAQKDDSLAVNAYAIWLYDTGDIKGFLETIARAENIAQRQTIIPKKDYHLLKLYWIMDWTAEQRDLSQSYEPYFSQVFESVKNWKLPKKIREGYWYFMFYSLLNQGKFKEAAKIGPDALKHGAEIKGNLAILLKILAGKISKQWDQEQRKFVKA